MGIVSILHTYDIYDSTLCSVEFAEQSPIFFVFARIHSTALQNRHFEVRLHFEYFC